jgi:Zn-dependent protease
LDYIIAFVATVLALILGTTLHEFSHAFSADLLGDPTPRAQGRVTLNPAAHFDPIGGLMMVFSSIPGSSFGLGWGKPVMVTPTYLRFGPRVGGAIVSFAGPFSNLVLATLCALPLRIASAQGIPLSPEVEFVLYVAVSTNIGLALFNLLPIPPLDGFSVLRGLVSTIRTRWAYDLGDQLDQVQAYGPWIFIALIALNRVLPLRYGLIGAILMPFQRPLMWLIAGIRI